MNIFTSILGTISILTCFKLIVVLALFVLNLYLYFSEPKVNAFKKCSSANDRVKKMLTILSGVASINGGYVG
jgi:hypothetical protein